MKKLKNRKLKLNKMSISRIQNASSIVGGTAAGAEPHHNSEQEQQQARATEWCTQETLQSGEVTSDLNNNNQNQNNTSP